MLPYLGSGRRDYRRAPVRPHARGHWEFQAFLSGRPVLTLARDRVMGPATGGALVISRPDCVHGWSGDGEPAEVAVFHFHRAPEEVRRVLARRSWCLLPLDERARVTIRRLVDEAQRELAAPRPWSDLRYERILIDLSIEAVRLAEVGPVRERPEWRARVDRCIAWYLERLPEDPALAAVARANGLSLAHARRLFHAVLGRGPHEVLAGLRLHQALRLIELSDLPIATIAERLGYSEPGAFSRAFKRHHGASPLAWRQGRAARRSPGPAGQSDGGLE